MNLMWFFLWFSLRIRHRTIEFIFHLNFKWSYISIHHKFSCPFRMENLNRYYFFCSIWNFFSTGMLFLVFIHRCYSETKFMKKKITNSQAFIQTNDLNSVEMVKHNLDIARWLKMEREKERCVFFVYSSPFFLKFFDQSLVSRQNHFCTCDKMLHSINSSLFYFFFFVLAFEFSQLNRVVNYLLGLAIETAIVQLNW